MRIDEIIVKEIDIDVDSKPDAPSNARFKINRDGTDNQITSDEIRQMQISYKDNPQMVRLIQLAIQQPHITTMPMAIAWANTEYTKASSAKQAYKDLAKPKQGGDDWNSDKAKQAFNRSINNKGNKVSAKSPGDPTSIDSIFPGLSNFKTKINKAKDKMGINRGKAAANLLK